jgi:hypothetical protein
MDEFPFLAGVLRLPNGRCLWPADAVGTVVDAMEAHAVAITHGAPALQGGRLVDSKFIKAAKALPDLFSLAWECERGSDEGWHQYVTRSASTARTAIQSMLDSVPTPPLPGYHLYVHLEWLTAEAAA